ncbi:hypothetical protein BpHYR1_037861 [Brachionus plicatilis]|uniref:Uncharacterized protein n=1 Tax=Brachionus plicatilis TaxID=10195 RepID=A0A3M7RQY7_BRAPC|nr:hypothetical protein BpHYR1_037861 [Brachionus plicatilis]
MHLTNYFGSSRLGELWFIYYWNSSCSQKKLNIKIKLILSSYFYTMIFPILDCHLMQKIKNTILQNNQGIYVHIDPMDKFLKKGKQKSNIKNRSIYGIFKLDRLKSKKL